MADLGITEFGRDRIIRRAYDAVGIITFFTAGEPEVRGWNVERGGTAVDAAGKIHTDLAKGFIRAEVTAFDDIQRAGSMREVKAKNLQRLEGKDYIMKDGDVVFFRSGLCSAVAVQGVRSIVPARSGESLRSIRSRFAFQRALDVAPGSVHAASDVRKRLARANRGECPARFR